MCVRESVCFERVWFPDSRLFGNISDEVSLDIQISPDIISLISRTQQGTGA